MDSVLNCGGSGWFMIASGLVFYGLLALAGAALVKYLVFGGRTYRPDPQGGKGARPVAVETLEVAGVLWGLRDRTRSFLFCAMMSMER